MMMKKHVLSFLLIVSIFGTYQSVVFSFDDNAQEQLVLEVNEVAVQKLGLSLEQISLLFLFKEKTLIAGEVLDDYLLRDHMKKMLEEEYLVLVEEKGLAPDLTFGDGFFYFTLTEKAQIIVAKY